MRGPFLAASDSKISPGKCHTACNTAGSTGAKGGISETRMIPANENPHGRSDLTVNYYIFEGPELSLQYLQAKMQLVVNSSKVML
jgi:hypothetical protein